MLHVLFVALVQGPPRLGKVGALDCWMLPLASNQTSRVAHAGVALQTVGRKHFRFSALGSLASGHTSGGGPCPTKTKTLKPEVLERTGNGFLLGRTHRASGISLCEGFHLFAVDRGLVRAIRKRIKRVLLDAPGVDLDAESRYLWFTWRF